MLGLSLHSLPNIGFFSFMSVYHTPLIIRITLEFTNGTKKNRKRDFLRTSRQELRVKRSYVHFKRFTLLKMKSGIVPMESLPMVIFSGRTYWKLLPPKHPCLLNFLQQVCVYCYHSMKGKGYFKGKKNLGIKYCLEGSSLNSKRQVGKCRRQVVPCRVAVGHPGRQGPELLGNHRDVGNHCFSNEPSWGDLSTDGLMWDRYDGRMNKIWFKYNFIISKDQVYFPALFSLFILIKEAIVKKGREK